MLALVDGFRQDFISFVIDQKARTSLKSLVQTYNLDRHNVKGILDYLIDVVFLGEEPKVLASLVDDILDSVHPVGGVAPDDYLFITNDVRAIFESTRTTLLSLGVLINGIPPYQFHDYFDNDTLVLRKIKYIDH